MKMIIANWKMNGTKKLLDEFLESDFVDKIILGVPSVFALYAKNKNKNAKISAQDCSIFPQYGAYTGEVSAGLLKDVGIDYAIIGHSERRSLMYENTEALYQKLRNVVDAGIHAIFCVDDSFKEQIDEKIARIFVDAPNSVTIAYEPVSAIGTGVVPSIQEISDKVSEIKRMYDNVKVVYGGSVNSSNSGEILGIDGIDGVLIGGASLKFEEMRKIASF